MKKFFKSLFALAVVLMVSAAFGACGDDSEEINVVTPEPKECEPYAALSNGNKVLTFYYDTQKEERGGMSIGPFGDSSSRGWSNNCKNVTSVIFDASFADCTTITSTAYWFSGCDKLSSITGIKNLRTDNVTNMRFMFNNCKSMTTLDVTGFNTENVTDMCTMFGSCENLGNFDVTGFNTKNVTDMSGMFASCENLGNLDVTGFNTSKVVDMSFMFSICKSLKNLDVTGFNTEKVTDMSGMFGACENLRNLDVTSFNTSNVVDMSWMFDGCTVLKVLDLSHFNTENVTNLAVMFDLCESLTTIYVGEGWSTMRVNDGRDMFYHCIRLVGGKGTAWDENHIDHEYARIDNPSNGKPGYLTNK